jgi:hypothetical protein
MPIAVNADTTIKAIAIKLGWANSDVSSFTYTLKEYHVTYNANQATSGDVPVDLSAYNKTDNAIVMDENTLIKTGYSFADGQLFRLKRSGISGDGYAGKRNCGCYIVCKVDTEQYTVTFDAREGTVSLRHRLSRTIRHTARVLTV